MARVIFALAFSVLFGACKFEKSSGGSGERARIWPPGDGKLVRFDLGPQTDAPVLVSSKDVQVQLRGGMTILNFAAVTFELSPQRQEPIELDEFRIQVYQRAADGGLKLLQESEDHDLRDQKLTREKPRETTRELNVEIAGVQGACEQGCVVNIEADYFGVAAETSVLGMRASFKSGNSARSAQRFIQLGAGISQPWPPAQQPASRAEPGKAPPKASGTLSTREAILGGCAWLTEAEVSDAVGRAMRYDNVVPRSNHCTLKPESGSGEVFLSVIEEMDLISAAMQTADEFESILLGDRALWLPKVSQLYVDSGKMTIAVRVAEVNAPRTDRESAQREAVALARLLMSKVTTDPPTR